MQSVKPPKLNHRLQPSLNGLTPMVWPLGALGLVGCGGGGTTATSGSSNVSGVVSKGPLSNARVYLDYNDNGVFDEASEPSILTDGEGGFELEPGQTEYAIRVITDQTTTDTSSGSVLADIKLSAPTGATVVTPLTTVMQEAELTADQVKTVLGVPDGVDPLSFNPYGDGVDAAEALQVEAISQKVIATVRSIAAVASGTGQVDAGTAFDTAFTGLTAKLAASDSAVDLTDTTVLTEVADSARSALSSELADDPDAVAVLATFDSLKSGAVNSIASINGVIDSATTEAIENGGSLSDTALKNAFSSVTVVTDNISEASQAGDAAALLYTTADDLTAVVANAAPTAIVLSNQRVAEESDNLLVGLISVTDADQPSGEAFQYEIVGDDAAAFKIVVDGDEVRLELREAADYETKASYSIGIKVRDSGGKTGVENFTIAVQNITENVQTTTIDGVTASPFSGATVFADKNNNGELDTNEESAITQADGSFSLDTVSAQSRLALLTNDLTVDEVSGHVISGITLLAPGGSTTVSPLTTLMVHTGLDSDALKTAIGFSDAISTAIGDLKTYNPVEDTDLSAADLAYIQVSEQILALAFTLTAIAAGAGVPSTRVEQLVIDTFEDLAEKNALAFRSGQAEAGEQSGASFVVESALDSLIAEDSAGGTGLISGVLAGGVRSVLEPKVVTLVDQIGGTTPGDTVPEGEFFAPVAQEWLSSYAKFATEVETALAADGDTARTAIGAIQFEKESGEGIAENLAPSEIYFQSEVSSETPTRTRVDERADGDETPVDLIQLGMTDSNDEAVTWSLLDIEGTDDADFDLVDADGNALTAPSTTAYLEFKANAQPDFEAQAAYTLAVSVVDDGGKVFADSLLIQINNVAEI